MKKFWSDDKYKIRQERIKRKYYRRETKKRLGKRSSTSYKNDSSYVPKNDSSYVPEIKRHRKINVPENLQLFDNTEETLRFCNKMADYLSKPGTSVFVDFDNLRSFSIDVLTLIWSIMESKNHDTNVNGNLPRDEKVASEFKESGFFSRKFDVQPRNLPKPTGLILAKYSENKVQPETAEELVDFAKKHTDIDNDCLSACFKTLIELMINTHNHASTIENKSTNRKSNLKNWFVSVHCKQGKANFVFLDLGVGILNSASAKSKLKRLGVSILSYGSIPLLKDAFNEKMRSITGKPGRGLGLSRIRENSRNGLLSDFRVLTSNIIGSVPDLEFKKIDRYFDGTAFSWTLSSEIRND